MAWLRLFLWRRRRGLAITYLVLLVLGWGAYIFAHSFLPRSLDTGLTVAARAFAYHRTFAPVDEAREELLAGDARAAEARLSHFLAERGDIAKATLYTHAVHDATELLIGIAQRQERFGRAVRLAQGLTDRTPQHAGAWHLRGKAEEKAGDLTAAEASYEAAFRLSPLRAGVADDLIAVLGERVKLVRAAAVGAAYAQARKRVQLVAQVKVGTPRRGLQKKVLQLADIPIEQAVFRRTVELRGLPRGLEQSAALPPLFFADWRGKTSTLTIQARFEHVAEGLVVHGLRVTDRQGVARDIEVDRGKIRTLHRRGSLAMHGVEFEVALDPETIQGCALLYSCPEVALGTEAQAILAKAAANVSTRRGS